MYDRFSQIYGFDLLATKEIETHRAKELEKTFKCLNEFDEKFETDCAKSMPFLITQLEIVRKCYSFNTHQKTEIRKATWSYINQVRNITISAASLGIDEAQIKESVFNPLWSHISGYAQRQNQTSKTKYPLSFEDLFLLY